MTELTEAQLREIVRSEMNQKHSVSHEAHADPHEDLRFGGKCPHCDGNIGVCAGCKTIQKLDEDGKVQED